MTIRQLFTHTSGQASGPDPELGKLQRARAIALTEEEGGSPSTLEASVKRLAAMPLSAHPGTKWQYASGHTILGRCVEVWSGMNFAEYLEANILGPLQMTDTKFTVTESNRDRFTKNYSHGAMPLEEGFLGDYFEDSRIPEPSGGLTGTMRDYFKFCQCLLSNMKGQSFDGGNGAVRLLGRKTVEFMGSNRALLPVLVFSDLCLRKSSCLSCLSVALSLCL